MQLSLSSSATSTLSACMAWGFCSWASASSFCKSKSSSMVNVLPWPNLLLTEIVPPINVTRFLVIGIPSPVPPYDCPPDTRSCSKGSNRWLRNASLIPIPVSLTVKLRRVLPAFFHICRISSRIVPPSGVNLRALDNRLINTWFSLSPSPMRTVLVRFIKGTLKVSPLSAA